MRIFAHLKINQFSVREVRGKRGGYIALEIKMATHFAALYVVFIIAA
jgi:hypothetical protein